MKTAVIAFSAGVFFTVIVLFSGAASPKPKDEIIPFAVPELASSPSAARKTIQIRIFTINRGKMNSFVDAWLKGVYPLRVKSGFKIEGAWIVQEKNKFIWLLSYDGIEAFKTKDSAYYASQNRINLSPDPAEYIAEAESYFLKPVVP